MIIYKVKKPTQNKFYPEIDAVSCKSKNEETVQSIRTVPSFQLLNRMNTGNAKLYIRGKKVNDLFANKKAKVRFVFV